MLDNKTKLREEINKIKDRLSLIEELVDDDKIGLPGLEGLSDDQVQNVWEKLRLSETTLCVAKDFLVMYTKQVCEGDNK